MVNDAQGNVLGLVLGYYLLRLLILVVRNLNRAFFHDDVVQCVSFLRPQQLVCRGVLTHRGASARIDLAELG